MKTHFYTEVRNYLTILGVIYVEGRRQVKTKINPKFGLMFNIFLYCIFEILSVCKYVRKREVIREQLNGFPLNFKQKFYSNLSVDKFYSKIRHHCRTLRMKICMCCCAHLERNSLNINHSGSYYKRSRKRKKTNQFLV